jgi:TetR/AcrR family transcriptional regulator
MDNFISKQDLAKQKLLDAGEKLFAAFGYEGTSVRMIAKQMNINPAMIDYYFGSKENFYNEIFTTRLKVLNEGMMQIEKMKGSAIEKIRLFFTTYLTSVERNKHFHKLLLREMCLVNVEGATKKLILSSMRCHFQLLSGIVENGREKHFSNIDPGLFSLSVLMMAPMITAGNHFTALLSSCEKKLPGDNKPSDNLENFFLSILLNAGQPVHQN